MASGKVSLHLQTAYRVDLEAARRRIDELEVEARESEMVRRRLHNMVQELKGNIRVFARVRPLLSSDVPDPAPPLLHRLNGNSLFLRFG